MDGLMRMMIMIWNQVEGKRMKDGKTIYLKGRKGKEEEKGREINLLLWDLHTFYSCYCYSYYWRRDMSFRV